MGEAVAFARLWIVKSQALTPGESTLTSSFVMNVMTDPGVPVVGINVGVSNSPTTVEVAAGMPPGVWTVSKSTF